MREAFNAGKIETTAVINIEQVAINIIELVLFFYITTKIRDFTKVFNEL